MHDLASDSGEHIAEPGNVEEPGGGVGPGRFHENVVGLVFAQVFGQRDFWKLVAHNEFRSTAKRLVEEGLECGGYLLILFGLVEERFFPRMRDDLSD